MAVTVVTLLDRNYLQSVYSHSQYTKCRRKPMNPAASAELTAGLAARTSSRDARRWIERQLRWERTLGRLRNRGTTQSSRAA